MIIKLEADTAVRNLSFLFIILVICGCSSSKKAIVSEALGEIPVVTGSVINPSSFEKGGTLHLNSFKAGAGAAADDETDQLSGMVIKGIQEALVGENTHFTVQAENQIDSDYVLDGHIEDYGHHGHLARLSIDGEIWLRTTGEKIFLFKASSDINTKTQDPKNVAYQIGESIAHNLTKPKEQGL